MGKSKCAKSPISYLTTAPPEFETSKLLLKAVALAYSSITFGVMARNQKLFFFSKILDFVKKIENLRLYVLHDKSKDINSMVNLHSKRSK